MQGFIELTINRDRMYGKEGEPKELPKSRVIIDISEIQAVEEHYYKNKDEGYEEYRMIHTKDGKNAFVVHEKYEDIIKRMEQANED